MPVKPELWLIMHDPQSTVGTTERWCHERSVDFRIMQGCDLDPDNRPDAAILFGGDMQVWETDKYPWLGREKKFVSRMLSDDRPVFGLCLGAQLMAEQLGGEVTNMRQNIIGWYPVESEAGVILPLHWHSSKFALPAGTTRIAGDELINQGFRRASHQVAFQFHAEMDEPRVAHALTKWKDQDTGRVQEPAEILLQIEAKIEKLREWYFAQLDAWWKDH